MVRRGVRMRGDSNTVAQDSGKEKNSLLILASTVMGQ